MKTTVNRLSTHQNAKVFAVLFALTSLVFLVPFALIAVVAGPRGSGPGLVFIVLMPLLYLVIGYLMVAFSCWLYNVMVPHIGGIEFESDSA